MADCIQREKAGHWIESCKAETAEGAEEIAIFTVLAYSLDFAWMSVGTIAARAGVPDERVRRFIDRKLRSGHVVRHPSRPDLYGESEAVAPWLNAAARRSSLRAAG